MTEHVRLTRAERRAETRERLMAAAAEVFAERGISGAPVELICERAGYTRGAFYSNFESKDELCLVLLQATKDSTLVAIDESLDEPSTDELDAVGAVLAAFVSRIPMDQHVLLLHQEMELHAQRDPGFRAAYRDFVVQTHGQISEVILTALARKGLQLTLPIDLACALAEEQFIRSRREGVIFEDTDGGQLRLREGLRDVVRAISAPVT